jgi:putative NADH-flavin reductase
MKIVVIGAAGQTGRAVVERALAAGHDVTAFVHETKDVGLDPRVRVVEGDAMDRTAVDSAMLGQDAVIDTIGGKNPFKTTTLEANSAATIAASMQANGVRRLVVISMIGEGKSEANTNWWQHLVLSTLLRADLKNKAAMEAIVDTSGLDWVIVRPPFLNDDPGTGIIRVLSAESEQTAHKLTRSDLAAFMVAQISSNEYLHKAVAVVNS